MPATGATAPSAHHHDTSSINTPMPTITRKLQNTGATGGWALGNSFKPLSSASMSWARIRLASLGTWIA